MSQKKSQRTKRQSKEENRILLDFLNIQAEIDKTNKDKLIQKTD